MFDRRKFLKVSGTVAAGSIVLPTMACGQSQVNENASLAAGADITHLEDGSFEQGITNRVLKVLVNPVIIDKIEITQTKGRVFCMVYDKEGNRGITRINDKRLFATQATFEKQVAPLVIGKDARYVAQLPAEMLQHDRNYKLVSLGYWNGVGIIEIAIWDLLGRIAKQPAHFFLGKKVRDSYPVYISSLEREEPFEEETDRILQTMDATGATAVKFKIGGRMKNVEPYVKRTNDWVPYMRKKAGDATTLYVDGNSSYTAAEAIAVLKLLENYDIQFFEEPCYWQDVWAHKLVKDAATTCKIAGGEQDFSFGAFKLMAYLKALDTLQPDAYYHGGLVRTLKISYLAQAFGLEFTPHSPKAGPMAAAPNQIFAVAPRLSNHQEYRVMGHEKQKKWHNPIIPKNGELTILDNPGLGIIYDEDIWKKATVLLSIDTAIEDKN